ncbi:MAG: L,D-transpeptidase family protein [Nocardioidaceae bacterium]
MTLRHAPSRSAVFAVLAVLAGLAGPPALTTSTPASATSAAQARSGRTVTLDGVRVSLRTGTKQVVTVNHTRGWHARVTFWRWQGGGWHLRYHTVRGGTGYGGLVAGDQRQQGTGTTPLGTYRMTHSFGNSPRPAGTALPFRRVRPGDYWVQDNRSAYYNYLRNKAAGGFRWWLPPSNDNSSEHLADYPSQYRWAIVVDFNRPHPVHHRGSGIFLHVNGDGATAGCVSTPRWFIRQTLSRLRPGLVPLIAIGR